MAVVTVSLLRCPESGIELIGADRDVIYFCKHCAKGFQLMEGGGFAEVPVYYQPPAREIDPARTIHLPMWALKVSIETITPGDVKKRVNQITKDLNWIWVTGFRAWRASYFGDPGLFYTSKRIEPNFSMPTSEQVPAGCSINAYDAAEYRDTYVLSIIDRSVDVANIEVKIDVHEYYLVSVPFEDADDKIIDTQLKWEWPSIFVEDILPLREMLKS